MNEKSEVQRLVHETVIALSCAICEDLERCDNPDGPCYRKQKLLRKVGLFRMDARTLAP